MTSANQTQPECADKGFNSCLLRALPWVLVVGAYFWAGSLMLARLHEWRIQSGALALRQGMSETEVRRILSSHGLTMPKGINETDLPFGSASLVLTPFAGPLSSLRIRFDHRGRLEGISTVRYQMLDEEDGQPWPLAP